MELRVIKGNLLHYKGKKYYIPYDYHDADILVQPILSGVKVWVLEIVDWTDNGKRLQYMGEFEPWNYE